MKGIQNNDLESLKVTSEVPKQSAVISCKRKSKRSVFTTPDHIQQRFTEANGRLQFHCTICLKSFSSRSQCYYHLGCANDGAKKFKCDHCEKSFSSRSHLYYHLESHSTQLHQCSICEKLFCNRIVLKKHEKLHDKTHAFDCNQCDKKFRSKESLAAHQRYHGNNFNYECNICDKKYAAKSTLKQHMLKHFTKKYECSICRKSFQRNSTLQLHIKRHSKSDTFVCSTCSKKFSDAGALARHAKLHEDVVRYQCKHCEISTIRKDNMLRHVRNMHSEEDFQNCVEVIAPSPIETDKSHSNISYTNSYVDDSNLPKTIENSSVIKCIGNVEPVKIPNTINSTECNNLKKTSVSNNSNALHVGSRMVFYKKLKKRYDPIEMYRKILIPEDEVPGEDNFENYSTSHTCEPSPISVSEKSVEQQRTTSNSAKFIEMHWRKNYKYTYEYKDY